MLGWHIYISRKRDGGFLPATFESEAGDTVEAWDGGTWGLRRARDLAQADEAMDLGGNGYPCRYTAQARVLQHSTAVPLRLVWNRDTKVPAEGVAPAPRKHSVYDCPPDEWLVIEAWDMS